MSRAAKHCRASRWSGNPEELAETALAGQGIMRSASGGSHGCSISISYRNREHHFDTPDEFLAKFKRVDSRGIRAVVLGYNDDRGSNPLRANVVLYRYIIPTYVDVHGGDQSVVDGVARSLAATFGKHRFAWWGMRLYAPGGTTLMTRLRAQVGELGTIVVTATVTAAVTFAITKLLS